MHPTVLIPTYLGLIVVNPVGEEFSSSNYDKFLIFASVEIYEPILRKIVVS